VNEVIFNFLKIQN